MKLLAFFGLALLVHGPLSPLLPTAFEATLLYYARLYPAWLLALVGTLARPSPKRSTTGWWTGPPSCRSSRR